MFGTVQTPAKFHCVRKKGFASSNTMQKDKKRISDQFWAMSVWGVFISIVYYKDNSK